MIVAPPSLPPGWSTFGPFEDARSVSTAPTEELVRGLCSSLASEDDAPSISLWVQGPRVRGPLFLERGG
jgi:hypothetical protein